MALAMPVLVQCTKYDDTWIRDKFGELDSKISRLEQSINDLNAYKSIVDNLQKGKLISSVRGNGDGTFTITFNDQTTTTITVGKGEKGDKGDPGDKGDSGDPGDKGDPGENGTDGVTPDFKIQDGDWYVSYDDGASWTKLGSASSGDSFFKDVFVDGDFLVLVLIDGTEVRINLNEGQGEGGDDPVSTAPTLEDWLGSWSNSKNNKGTLTFYESGGKFYCYSPTSNLNAVPIQFHFNAEDGTIDFTSTRTDGYCGYFTGEDSQAHYVYYYAQDADKNYLNITPGDVILKGTMSEDKTSFTFSSGIENCTRVIWYDNTGKAWGSAPQNWIDTYNKDE
jgi:hypothetical protein